MTGGVLSSIVDLYSEDNRQSLTWRELNQMLASVQKMTRLQVEDRFICSHKGALSSEWVEFYKYLSVIKLKVETAIDQQKSHHITSKEGQSGLSLSACMGWGRVDSLSLVVLFWEGYTLHSGIRP